MILVRASILLLVIAAAAAAEAQTVLPGIDPAEKAGERPYEMVWAKRQEPAPPTVRFDDLRGWSMRVSGGAEAMLQATRAQNMWNRPVARLRYRCDVKTGSSPKIWITPPAPVKLAEPSDCAEMWVWGNRWDWENTPGTPPVQITLRLTGADGETHAVVVDSVRWQKWWLLHRKLPPGLKFPAQLDSLEFTGGSQPEWRDIYLDSIRFYHETTGPIRFNPRPARNLTLFAGQSPGGNTGPGKLPFPTREDTILPMQLAGPFQNNLTADGHDYVFDYMGADGRIRYRFEPAKGLAGITAEMDGKPVGRLMEGGKIELANASPGSLESVRRAGNEVVALYGSTAMSLRIRQKSLIVDVVDTSGAAAAVIFGHVHVVSQPRTIYVPPITYGGTNPCVLLSLAGRKWVYTSIWPDWYRSNGSELIGAESASETTAEIQGSIRYTTRTDGKRNPMFERIFVTVSPRFEEVLPVVPNPKGLHAQEAVGRLWQESWGPEDYAKEMSRCEILRAYGIEKLIQCNHEITWRDNGESFTLRTHAAPKKGGDTALQSYVKHQRGLGWLSGLYTNYTDFAPVNEHWTPDGVQRFPDGEWRGGWPRCWAEKPMKAVEFDAKLASQVQRRYDTNSAYTDVSTAVAPWGYVDFDARVPGAGTFAQTFYCYGELLRNDSRAYGGPIFSEGTYQWLYAGLADGNYGHTYNGRPLSTQPLLPVFDLYQVHSKECDIGVSWTSFFCDGIPDWKAPKNVDFAIDRFLLATLAYGHIGWLVEEHDFGIPRACRSYYMLQQVQARYGLQQPSRTAYWDGRTLRSVSEAIPLDLPAKRRQLYVEYPGGLQLWLNDSPSEEWRIRVGSQEIVLPPAGWAAASGGGKRGADLFSYSALYEGSKVDYLRSAAYIYLDGRGRLFSAPEAASDGALAISPEGTELLRIIRISGDGEFAIRRPFGVKGAAVGCEAFDEHGKLLGRPNFRDSGSETRIQPLTGAIRYELAFGGRAKRPHP
jgi:hypothetical protein